MPFLAVDAEVCRKERALLSLNIIIQKTKATILDVGRRCCSRELQNSKTNKAKVEFLVDKPKVVKTKHNDASQEEAIADERYATQPLLHEG